jgi:hypothetical protein
MLIGKVFYEVVVPLMELDETALICISTIKDGDNFYSKLLNLKDASTGKDFFKKFSFVLGCAACRAAGKASECTHNMHDLPPWQSGRKHAKIREMMADQKELLEQETMGIMQNKNKRAFAPEIVDRFLNNDRFTPLHHPKEVFITIDPNGGGDSDFALVSTYFDRGTMIIAGFESINSKGPSDHNPIIKLHIEWIQSRFPQTCIVFIIENNLGFEAKHIHHFCKQNLTGNICYMAEKEHVGFHTDHKVKELMYHRFVEWLTRDAVRFDEKLIALNPDKPTEKVMADLIEQLQTYSVITELPKTAFGKIRTTYSGKVSSGAKDDVLVTLQLSLVWFRQFYDRSEYSTYR